MSARDEKPLHRRDFFGEAIKRLLAPVSDIVEGKLGDFPPKEKDTVRLRLRPPGALPERLFLETCMHSGKCVEVCPARAIHTWRGEDSSKGTPYVEPNVQACVVCETLACTKNCPTGALQPLLNASQIRMGIAMARPGVCVRTRGDECRICVDKCPIPGAIKINDNNRVQVLENCVGCGICEMLCPTTPRAIVVNPL